MRPARRSAGSVAPSAHPLLVLGCIWVLLCVVLCVVLCGSRVLLGSSYSLIARIPPHCLRATLHRRPARRPSHFVHVLLTACPQCSAVCVSCHQEFLVASFPRPAPSAGVRLPFSSSLARPPPAQPRVQVLERAAQRQLEDLLDPTGAPAVGVVVRLPSSLLLDHSVPYAWAARVPGWSEDTGLLCVVLLHDSGAWKVDTMSAHSPCWRHPLNAASLKKTHQW